MAKVKSLHWDAQQNNMPAAFKLHEQLLSAINESVAQSDRDQWRETEVRATLGKGRLRVGVWGGRKPGRNDTESGDVFYKEFDFVRMAADFLSLYWDLDMDREDEAIALVEDVAKQLSALAAKSRRKMQRKAGGSPAQ